VDQRYQAPALPPPGTVLPSLASRGQSRPSPVVPESLKRFLRQRDGYRGLGRPPSEARRGVSYNSLGYP